MMRDKILERYYVCHAKLFALLGKEHPFISHVENDIAKMESGYWKRVSVSCLERRINWLERTYVTLERAFRR